MNYNQPERILVIDDEPISNFIITSIFGKYYPICRISSCLSASEGLEFLHDLVDQQQELPDYIFLDLNMKSMNGWDFLRCFEDRGFTKYGTRIVILTSSVFRSDIERAKLISSVHEFVSKPLTGTHLTKIFCK